jgi:hypothetical protein
LLCEENGLDNDPEKAIRIKIVWKETHWTTDNKMFLPGTGRPEQRKALTNTGNGKIVEDRKYWRPFIYQHVQNKIKRR